MTSTNLQNRYKCKLIALVYCAYLHILMKQELIRLLSRKNFLSLSLCNLFIKSSTATIVVSRRCTILQLFGCDYLIHKLIVCIFIFVMTSKEFRRFFDRSIFCVQIGFNCEGYPVLSASVMKLLTIEAWLPIAVASFVGL